jgi:hypothetical protein
MNGQTTTVQRPATDRSIPGLNRRP